MVADEGERLLWRIRHGAVLLMLMAFSLNTDSGRVFSDTKMDLVLNPGGFLTRATHLWEPLGTAGQLQNQAYGYLFPMGPFFWFGNAIGLPGWATQRLWWALVLGVSYLGFVLLARRLGLGGEWTRLIAGVAFAVSPLVLTVLGRSSIEAWPPALAPWILVPLVSPSARSQPLRAAALSGLAVACMGGVNATVNLAAILPAVLWLLTRVWDRAQVRLLAAWVAAVASAAAWWLIPLLALSRWSPPFLDYIESASFTTRTTALVQVLRGSANWVAYLAEAGSLTGYALLTDRVSILTSVIVVATGLAGLAMRRTHHRRWLALLLVTGVVLVSLGHAGPLDGWWASDVRGLLDSVLAPLRNVHKFDILIRLSIALGFAAALSAAAEGATAAESHLLRRILAATGAFAVAGAAAPFFGLATAPVRSFESIPTYWGQAAGWLADHGAQGRTLLLPGSRFADYVWGQPGDEPLQAATGVSWDVRNAIPLTAPEHVRWIDGLEQRIRDGRGGDDLAPALADAGVGFVLVRTDLNVGSQRATRPAVVREVLQRSPGFKRVAQFGPGLGGPGTNELASDEKLGSLARAIEIYAVEPTPSRAVVVPAADVKRVVGGPEVASRPGAVAGTFVLDTVGRPSTASGLTGPVILTDSPRRREVNVGVGAFGGSATLSLEDPLRIEKPVRDYGSSELAGAEAVAAMLGGTRLSASSSASDADASPAPDVSAAPFAAFDGSRTTLWRPNPKADLRGSWLDLALARPVSTDGGVVLLDEGTAIRSLQVMADGGRTTIEVRDDTARLPPSRTRTLRLSVASVDPQAGPTRLAAAGIREVTIPEVRLERTIVLPQVPGGVAVDQVQLTADVGRDGCLTVNGAVRCARGLVRIGEEAAGIDRTWVSRAPDVQPVSLMVRGLASERIIGEIKAAKGLPAKVEASSVLVPGVGGSALVAADGDPHTTWIAATNDPDPTLTVTWPESVTISGLELSLDDWAAASPPTRARVVVDGNREDVTLDATGRARFPAMSGTTVAVHFGIDQAKSSLDPYTLETMAMPMGVSELAFTGAPRVPVTSAASSGQAVSLACGQGPKVVVNGRSYDSAVDTTVGALLRGDLVPARVCQPVDIPSGTVRLQVTSSQDWVIGGVTIGDAKAPPAPEVAVAARWESTSRVLDVPAREALSVLRIPENANPGWTARVEGGAEPLEPVTLNGWQQGWIMPVGAAYSVVLEFTPDRPVRNAMLIAAMLPLGLLGLGLLQRRRSAPGEVTSMEEGRASGAALAVAAAAGAAMMGGAAVVSLLVACLLAVALARRFPGTRAAGIVTLLHSWVVSGRLTWVAGLSYLAAGSVLVLHPYGTPGYAADSTLAHLCALAAVSAVVVAACVSGGGTVDSDEHGVTEAPRPA